MALASGTSRMVAAQPTLHTRTAMVVAEALLPGVKFTVTPLVQQQTQQQVQAQARPQQDTPGGSGGGAGPPGGTDGGLGGGRQQLFLIQCRGAGVTAPGDPA